MAVSRTAILGYADRFSVARGQRIDFKVSCDGPATFGVEIVRLICADPTPGGPGVRYDAVDDLGGNKFPGRVQAIHPGSHVNVPASPALARLRGFGLAAMVWPTTPAKGRQAVMGWWREDTGTGFLLELDATGALALRLGDGSGEPLCLSTGVPLPEREWAFVAAAYEAETGMATVDQWLLRPRAGRRTDGEVRAMVERSWRKPGEVFFRLAAWMDGVDGLAGGHFNGKIDRPRLVSEALSADDLHALAVTAAPDPARPDVIAAWDFSRDIRGTRVHDTAANRLDGETVNLPARAVTGFNWDGTVLDWRLDPSQYGAIHFHDDDLHDCGWATDASWTVPEDATSGCYAARLHAAHLQADQESWIAFFVRPRPGRPTAPVAYLAATATYLAYANTHVKVDSQNSENLFESVLTLSEEELYLHIHRELGYSTYDTHADGSGVFHASRLRPLLTVRPGLYTFNYVNDSHITGWLEGLGQPYDVITDEDLHAEGRTLLDGYRVLITGSHPEYYSTPMWDAVDAFPAGWWAAHGPGRQRLLLADRLARQPAGGAGNAPRHRRGAHLGRGAGGGQPVVQRRSGRPVAIPRTGAPAPDRGRLRGHPIRPLGGLQAHRGEPRRAGRLHVRGYRRGRTDRRFRLPGRRRGGDGNRPLRCGAGIAARGARGGDLRKPRPGGAIVPGGVHHHHPGPRRPAARQGAGRHGVFRDPRRRRGVGDRLHRLGHLAAVGGW